MNATNQNPAIRALIFREEKELDPGYEVAVYALRNLSFKGARVCLGFRAFYEKEAYKRLHSRVPEELRGTVEVLRMGASQFRELRDGYYEGGLVFIDLDEKGRAFVRDPDTDGRVYLP